MLFSSSPLVAFAPPYTPTIDFVLLYHTLYHCYQNVLQVKKKRRFLMVSKSAQRITHK